MHPDEIWQPLSRPTFETAAGRQGDPLGGYRPGRSLEHEALDRAEREAQRTAKVAAKNAEHRDDVGPNFQTSARMVRAALRYDATSA